jgi:hypothetical protein
VNLLGDRYAPVEASTRTPGVRHRRILPTSVRRRSSSSIASMAAAPMALPRARVQQIFHLAEHLETSVEADGSRRWRRRREGCMATDWAREAWDGPDRQGPAEPVSGLDFACVQEARARPCRKLPRTRSGGAAHHLDRGREPGVRSSGSRGRVRRGGGRPDPPPLDFRGEVEDRGPGHGRRRDPGGDHGGWLTFPVPR